MLVEMLQARSWHCTVCALLLMWLARGVTADAGDTKYEAHRCTGTEVDWQPCLDLPQCGGCQAVDCAFMAWTDWSAGDSTGLCERQRGIATHANECGRLCQAALVETKNSSSCERNNVHPIDCVWGDWDDWSGCTCTCDGGQMSRDRAIVISPKNSGNLCEGRDRTQVSPCNTQKCDKLCIDAQWSDWKDWSDCSHSCEGGVQLRLREVQAESNDCGKPLSGLASEVRPCKSDVLCTPARDCTFTAWEEWSACTSTCNGVWSRNRHIETFGMADGAFCIGTTKEIRPCNLPEAWTDHCKVTPVIDCEMGDWLPWTSCSKSCGSGQRRRGREVVTESRNGGLGCEGALDETEGCNRASCDSEVVDCRWAAWSDWSSCAYGEAQRHRFRSISAMPKKGGRACGRKDAEETKGCEENVHGPTYCAWADWSPFGACSATCGNAAVMNRMRHMKVTESKPIGVINATASKYEQLGVVTVGFSQTRVRDLSGAFAAGFFLCLLPALFFARPLRSSRERRHAPDSNLLADNDDTLELLQVQ